MIIKGTADVKAHLSEFISRVRYGRERIVIARRGKPIAALIGIQDLHRLESLDRESDNNESEKHHPIMDAFGGWADRIDLDELVEHIYAERENASEREVNL